MSKKNEIIKIKTSNKDRFFYMVMSNKELRGELTLKQCEIILQKIIERCYGGCWWQHTKRNIFIDLCQYGNDLQNYIFNILMPSLF